MRQDSVLSCVGRSVFLASNVVFVPGGVCPDQWVRHENTKVQGNLDRIEPQG